MRRETAAIGPPHTPCHPHTYQCDPKSLPRLPDGGRNHRVPLPQRHHLRSAAVPAVHREWQALIAAAAARGGGGGGGEQCKGGRPESGVVTVPHDLPWGEAHMGGGEEVWGGGNESGQ